MARRRRSSGKKRRRSRKGMSEGKSFMSARGRKSRKRKGGRSRRRRGFLSETFSSSNMKNSGQAMIGGAGGGVLAHFINRFEMPGLVRFGVNVAASFLAGAAMDMPNVGAGIAGAYSMLATQQIQDGTLKEEYDYADPDVLSEYPQFADAAGNEMYLADDGNLYYLDEGEQMYLDENVYPNYVNASNY